MNAQITKKKVFSGIVAVLILMSLTAPVAMAAATAPPLVLPDPDQNPNPITATYSEYDLDAPASPALFGITLGGFSGSYSVNTNTEYLGWCLEYGIPTPTTNAVRLYSTYATNLPANAQTYTDPLTPIVANGQASLNSPIPWDQLNYLLNHKQGTAKEVQTAIWLLIWGEAPFQVTDAVTNMLNDARASVNFVPAPGQIIAVLLYIDGIGHDSETELQETIIELTVPPYYDRGDLPDGTLGVPQSYPTLNANGGPSHLVGPNLYLGQCVDAEPNGQPNTEALGDDPAVTAPSYGTCTSTDDEDGVQRTPNVNWTVSTGGSVNVTVAGGPGCLSGWIDWNGNGNLTDGGDNILDNVAVNTGTSIKTFTVPVPVNGTYYARFRLYPVDGNNSCTTARTPTGEALGGEVEDYQWGFVPTAVTLSGISASSAASPAALPLGIVTILGILLGGIVLARRPL